MKKTQICILALCIISVILCSCNHTNRNHVEAPQNQNSLSDSTDITPSVVIETPPDQYAYTFTSYQDVVQALTQKNSSEYSMLREEQDHYGTVYQNTLSEFASADIKIAIPQINENTIPLRNKDGYANITLLTSELYNLPWFWYHCVVHDQNLDVKIAYLDVIEDSEKNQTTTYVQILQMIAPDAPSPENYKKYESYNIIYEKNIVLKDGVTVTAMISEIKDSSKVYVMFYYDGLLISLYGDGELFSESFWKSFSIVYN